MVIIIIFILFLISLYSFTSWQFIVVLYVWHVKRMFIPTASQAKAEDIGFKHFQL